MSNEITPQDRAEARKFIGEAEASLQQAPWAGWVLRPLIRLIRWMISQ